MRVPLLHASNSQLTGHLQATADLIAQKRAEIAAKIAAMKKGAAAVSASTSVSASVGASPSPAGTPRVASGSHSVSPAPTDDLSRRVAEAKRRVAEAQSKLAVKDNPYMVRESTCYRGLQFQ